MAKINKYTEPSLFDHDEAYRVDLANAKATGKKPKRAIKKKEKLGHVGEIDAITKKQEEDGRKRAKEYDRLKKQGLIRDMFEGIVDECIDNFVKKIKQKP